MFRRIMLGLTFLAAFGVVGVGFTDTADARRWRGWRRPSVSFYYGPPRRSFYRDYRPYRSFYRDYYYGPRYYRAPRFGYRDYYYRPMPRRGIYFRF